MTEALTLHPLGRTRPNRWQVVTQAALEKTVRLFWPRNAANAVVSVVMLEVSIIVLLVFLRWVSPLLRQCRPGRLPCAQRPMLESD